MKGKIKLCLFFVVIILLLGGCTKTTELYRINDGNSDSILIVITACEDKVICYTSYRNLGCFRDEDLVLKYCEPIKNRDWETG